MTRMLELGVFEQFQLNGGKPLSNSTLETKVKQMRSPMLSSLRSFNS